MLIASEYDITFSRQGIGCLGFRFLGKEFLLILNTSIQLCRETEHAVTRGNFFLGFPEGSLGLCCAGQGKKQVFVSTV